MMLSGIRRAGTMAALVTASVTCAGAGTADAATVRKFVVDLAVDDYGGAVGTLSDTIIASNRYTLALTSTGGGSCGVVLGDAIYLGRTATLAETDSATGNPVTVRTPGDCRIWTGAATYTLSWVGVPGASGSLQVECVWLLGSRACTPGHVEGDVSFLPI